MSRPWNVCRRDSGRDATEDGVCSSTLSQDGTLIGPVDLVVVVRPLHRRHTLSCYRSRPHTPNLCRHRLRPEPRSIWANFKVQGSKWSVVLASFAEKETTSTKFTLNYHGWCISAAVLIYSKYFYLKDRTAERVLIFTFGNTHKYRTSVGRDPMPPVGTQPSDTTSLRPSRTVTGVTGPGSAVCLRRGPGEARDRWVRTSSQTGLPEMRETAGRPGVGG